MAGKTIPKDPLEAIELQRRVVEVLMVAAPDLGAAQKEMLRRYQANARNGLTLDEAFRLKPPKGGDGWWTLEDRAQRDRSIRAFHHVHLANLDAAAAAKEIIRLKREEASIVSELNDLPLPGRRQLARILEG